MITRRTFVAQTAGVAIASLGVGRLLGQAAGSPTAITVYKSASCGCCAKWVDHLRANGFAPSVHDEENMDAIKDEMGVPKHLRSCHTALVGGYVIEGHVPADVIRKLLRERPAVVGIAAPGMPNGSPGMEGPTKDTYQILTFDKTGATTVYATR